MFKVLFKTACEADNEIVKSQIMANHQGRNDDELIVSHLDEPADMVFEVPKIQKPSALIFDHSGTVHELGYPDQIEYNELLSSNDGRDAASNAREEIERIEKLPKECPSCHYLKPVSQHICPKCGFTPLQGEDVDVDRTRELEKLKKKTEAPVTHETKQQYYSELLGYQRAALNRGKMYSYGWVANQYKNKFGVWPRGLEDVAKAPSIATENAIKASFIRFAKSKAKK